MQYSVEFNFFVYIIFFLRQKATAIQKNLRWPVALSELFQHFLSTSYGDRLTCFVLLFDYVNNRT